MTSRFVTEVCHSRGARSGLWCLLKASTPSQGSTAQVSPYPGRRKRWNGRSQSSNLSFISNSPNSHTSNTFYFSSRHFSTSPFLGDAASPSAPTTPVIPSAGDAGIEQLATSSQELWSADAARILAEGETFASLGLGGYSPVGLLQSSMEIIHNTTGLPWWGAILVSTLCIRVLFLPVNFYLQKHTIRTHNVQPLVQKMKERQQVYMLAKNLEMANYERSRMNAVFKKHGVRPLLGLLPMLFQGVVLVSYFMAIRGMANAPVTSMMAGGALWFTDLTATDSTLILPILSSAAFLISTELGGEAGIVNPEMKKMKNVMRVFAIFMIFITSHLPAGLFMYWIPSTCFSMTFALVMKIQGVRDALGYPKLVDHTPSEDSTQTWKQRRDTRLLVEEKKAEWRKSEKAYKKQREDKNPKLFHKKPPPPPAKK